VAIHADLLRRLAVADDKRFEAFESLDRYRGLIIDGTGKFGSASRDELACRAARALELIVRFGGIDGAHHKAWVLDQVTRVLTEESYEDLVREARAGEDGPETYSWDEGIPP
jgi:hypothetical protein